MLPAASYALLPNLNKMSIFCHRRGIENLCRLFSTHPWTNVCVSDAWPVPATYHRPCCGHCDQRVGRSPERARPVQNSWRNRWFCPSMSVQDLESRRVQLKMWLSFSPAVPGSTHAQWWFFSFFCGKFGFSFLGNICVHRERYINIVASIFEIWPFLRRHRVSIVIGLDLEYKI